MKAKDWILSAIRQGENAARTEEWHVLEELGFCMARDVQIVRLKRMVIGRIDQDPPQWPSLVDEFLTSLKLVMPQGVPLCPVHLTFRPISAGVVIAQFKVPVAIY